MAEAVILLFPRQAPPLPPPLTSDELAYTNAPQLLAITGSFFSLAALAVVLRCYVRLRLLKIFGADDYVMLLAMALNTATFACIELRTQYGLGKHTLVLYMNPGNLLKFQKVQYVQSLVMMLGISSVKISIALTLLRLSNQKFYSRFLWTSIVFLILMTLGCGGSLVWQCTNPVSAAWDYTKRPPPFGTGNAKCYSNNVFRNLGLMNSVFNIITDVVFACLPIPLIWKLQLNRRTKISLIAILSLGWFACCAAVVKTVYQWRVFDELDGTVHDHFNTWGMIEFSLGVVAASLPTLKPLFKGLLETARAITSGGHTRRGTYRSKTAGYSKTTDAWSQEIGLESMSKQSTHGANASTRPTGLADREAWEAQRKDSDEDPLQPQRGLASDGIVRTTEISVN